MAMARSSRSSSPAPFTGACCTSTACSITDSAACTGTFQGPATACGSAGDPTTCGKANFNQLGGRTVEDVFDFLDAWFSNAVTADFNEMNSVTLQDIFDFLANYFAGC